MTRLENELKAVYIDISNLEDKAYGLENLLEG